MMRTFLPGSRVYICFNYYACNVPEGKLFHRMIVWVFSRMNQIRFVFRGEPVFRSYRRPFGGDHRAPGSPSAGGMDGCRHAATRGLSVETREPWARCRRPLLKFETTVRRGVRGASARRIRPSNHGITSQCSMIAAKCIPLSRYIPETKMPFRAKSSGLAVACGAQCAVEYRVACSLRHGTHRRAVDTMQQRCGGGQFVTSQSGKRR